MVCAESSASFSNTADFLMSSLGEATDRVTSMVLCRAVQYWHNMSGCGSGSTAEWGRRRGAAAYRRRKAPGDLLRRRGSLPRSRRAARRV